jgi:archaellum biogenesis protein FlaJ (TadC family)
MPLCDLLPTLPPVHIAFFTYLDKQLDKIDSFYSEREKEAQARNHALEIQLRELKDHRKIFYVSELTSFCFMFATFLLTPLLFESKRIRTLEFPGQRL